MSDHTYPVTFPAEGPVDVTVRQTSGDTTVTALDTSEVTVDVQASGPAATDLIAMTTVDYRSGTLHIELPQAPTRSASRSSVDIKITVPRGSAVDLRSGSGQVVMDGELGAITGKTGSGDITVSHAAGRVDLDTGSGDIEVAGSVASGTGSTGSGDVRVALLDGWFDVKTASGDITIGRAVAGELDARAASGDVTVGIAAGTAAHLDISSVSGRVRSELDETDAPSDTDRTLILSARTVSGHITLERRP